jgi:hypothetical protein
MGTWRRYLRGREVRLLALVSANLLAIGGFLGAGGQQPQEQVGGWRRIDMEAVQTRVRSGELSSREAEWYRPVDRAESR